MNAAKPPIWLALRAHLAADRRKTAVLVGLSVVLAAVYARWFWGSSPAVAGAAPAATAATNTAAAAAQTPAPTRMKPARPLVRDLARDPFAIRLDKFQVDPSAVTAKPNAPSAPAPAGPPNSKSGPAAQEFQLQSIISGTLPMAWINGRCVQPGGSIEGFTLEQIEPTRVVLRRGREVRVLTID